MWAPFAGFWDVLESLDAEFCLQYGKNDSKIVKQYVIAPLRVK
jgi:hypothetical protein